MEIKIDSVAALNILLHAGITEIDAKALIFDLLVYRPQAT